MENTGLSEDDFKLLSDALEFYPQKESVNEIMTCISAMVMTPNPEDYKKFLESRQKKTTETNSQRELMNENIRILQGKVLMLKRQLIEANLLKQSNDILGEKK